MIFNFVPLNRTDDIVTSLAAHLEDMGHVVTHGGYHPPPVFNLVGEGFAPSDIETIDRVRRCGYRLVMIVTEMASRAGRDVIVWNYNILEKGWQERAWNFQHAASLFECCWCLVAGTATKIKHWTPNAVDIELGYSNRLLLTTNSVPKVDFAFFGARTDRRERVIAEIRRSGHTVMTSWPDGLTAVDRDRMVQSAKIVLNIRQHDWWPLVSTARICAALHARRPIVCEPLPFGSLQKDWLGIARFASRVDTFAETAVSVLEMWRQEYARQMTEFRKMTPERCLKEAILALPVSGPSPEAGLDLEPEPSIVAQPEVKPNAADKFPPILVGTVRDKNLVQWKHRIWVVPQALGPVDLNNLNLSRLASVRAYSDVLAARRAIG